MIGLNLTAPDPLDHPMWANSTELSHPQQRVSRGRRPSCGPRSAEDGGRAFQAGLPRFRDPTRLNSNRGVPDQYRASHIRVDRTLGRPPGASPCFGLELEAGAGEPYGNVARPMPGTAHPVETHGLALFTRPLGWVHVGCQPRCHRVLEPAAVPRFPRGPASEDDGRGARPRVHRRAGAAVTRGLRRQSTSTGSASLPAPREPHDAVEGRRSARQGAGGIGGRCFQERVRTPHSLMVIHDLHETSHI